MAVIDADTHVIETEHTWDYLDPSEQQFRPIVVTPRGALHKYSKLSVELMMLYRKRSNK